MTKERDTIRTPLARARGLGSAKDGTRHWIMQRVSAVALVPLLAYLAAHARHFLPPPADYAGLAALLGAPVTALAVVLAAICGFCHAALGVQVIVEDYVHGRVARPLLLLLNQLVFFFAGAACVFSALYICFVLSGR